MRMVRVLLWASAVAAGAGCASNAPTSTFEELGPDANTIGFGRRFPADPEDRLFTFGPGDEVVLRVADEPTLDGVFVVRPDGYITLPLVDDLQVAGLTPGQVKEKLETRLLKYIRVPQVTVGTGRITSKHYFVVAPEETRGGYRIARIPHTGDVTLLEAFVEMGAPSSALEDDEYVRVIRADPRRPVRHVINLREIFLEGRSGGNIQIYPDDIVVVPASWLGRLSNFVAGMTAPFRSLFTLSRSVVEIDYGVRTIQGDTNFRRGRAFY
jgi:polysaccharide export outer membrane protein